LSHRRLRAFEAATGFVEEVAHALEPALGPDEFRGKDRKARGNHEKGRTRQKNERNAKHKDRAAKNRDDSFPHAGKIVQSQLFQISAQRKFHFRAGGRGYQPRPTEAKLIRDAGIATLGQTFLPGA
jgi:hypothetical protein